MRSVRVQLANVVGAQQASGDIKTCACQAWRGEEGRVCRGGGLCGKGREVPTQTRNNN